VNRRGRRNWNWYISID